VADPFEVRVYGLANPAVLFDERDAIARSMLGALGVSDTGRHEVTISDSSGWLSYVDRFERDERNGVALLPDADGARQSAEAMLRTLAAALSPNGAQWPARLRGITPLPAVFRPAGVLFVNSPRGGGGDHWLVRAQAYLPASADGRTSALVLGGQAEMRIGEGGRVIGYVGRWRALSGEVLRVQGIPPDADESGKTEPARMAYVLEGDGMPQYYLAPYHLGIDGGEVELASASGYSLLVTLTQRDTDAGTELIARGFGGSGDYAYNWATYSFDDVLDEGVVELGPGDTLREGSESDGSAATASAIRLPLAARVVLVNVKDRATGAFKHHQQQVFSKPSQTQSSDEPGWGG
jgi:hypothetical protein